jgi:hypothetical protein
LAILLSVSESAKQKSIEPGPKDNVTLEAIVRPVSEKPLLKPGLEGRVATNATVTFTILA